MVIKYYRSDNLKYSSRERRRVIPVTPFFQEERKSITLGDGGKAQLTIKAENLCDYVTIDGTRWFYTYHTYLNSKQVVMYIQRDVIGEFGLGQMFGQVERGYTNTLLKHRKELSVNEILKKRTYLKPIAESYGEYKVDNHDNEMWGILYFVKPTGIDPTTGQPYGDKININIPAFAPQVSNYPVIGNNTTFFDTASAKMTTSFYFNVGWMGNGSSGGNGGYPTDGTLTYWCNFTSNGTVASDGSITWGDVSTLCIQSENKTIENVAFQADVMIYPNKPAGEPTYFPPLVTDWLMEILVRRPQRKDELWISQPVSKNYTRSSYNYNDVVVQDGTTFYKYTGTSSVDSNFGNNAVNSGQDFINNVLLNFVYGDITYNGVDYVAQGNAHGNYSVVSTESKVSYNVTKYTRRVLTATEAGQLTINLLKVLVDEPYYILVFPLYDVKITGNDGSIFNIEKLAAFEMFNTVIQYLSGVSGNIVDAQIYPYCPDLMAVASTLNGFPFFDIRANTYSHTCGVDLLPYTDIKKEYIVRNYRIVSPEQSSQFSFNFYDYRTAIDDFEGKNLARLSINIKTALKPFSIIASAIVVPDPDSLKGLTYSSDMRGSQPSANGFECSLASNAFEEYKRNNSNFQQIFALQQDELAKTHEVERVNEKTSAVVNTLSATAMGAIAGGAIGGGVGVGAAIGAAAGGVAAGATVGIANAIQYNANEELRKYEVGLQQQNFDLQIGTIKALPNTINRISSFNEILLQDFWFVLETFECSQEEIKFVEDFIEMFGYGIGVFGFIEEFTKSGWFLRSTLNSSLLPPNLHNIASDELKGGIYYYE